MVSEYGLEKSDSNWDTVWANQWEPGKKAQHAFDCYINHFGKEDKYVNEDISIIDKNSIPNHNLLVGGFPCQDYSVAHTGAKGIEGNPAPGPKSTTLVLSSNSLYKIKE